MRYALINPEGRIDTVAVNIDPAVQTKKGWRWLPIETQAQPAFDPETQAVIGPIVTVEAARVVESYTVRSRSADEIEADRIRRVDGMSKIEFEIAFGVENRLRALEAKPALKRGEYRAELAKLLAEKTDKAAR